MTRGRSRAHAIAADRAQQQLSDAVQRESNDRLGWPAGSGIPDGDRHDRAATQTALAAYIADAATRSRRTWLAERGAPSRARCRELGQSGRGRYKGQTKIFETVRRPQAFTLQDQLERADQSFNETPTRRGTRSTRRAWIGDGLRLISTIVGLLVLLVGGVLVLQKAWKLAVDADTRRERESRFNKQIEAIVDWSSKAKSATTRSQLIGYAHMAPREAIGASCLTVAEGAPPARHKPTASHGSRCWSTTPARGCTSRSASPRAAATSSTITRSTSCWATSRRSGARCCGRRIWSGPRATTRSPDCPTGARSRRSYAAASASRSAAGIGFTLAMVDLDHFKQVNDSFGHPEGDAVLRRAGEAIRLSLRGSDRIFRLGGEEFVLLLETTDKPRRRGSAEPRSRGNQGAGHRADCRATARRRRSAGPSTPRTPTTGWS